MSSGVIRELIGIGGVGLVATTILASTPDLLRGRTQDVTTTIEVSLDVFDLDTDLLDEPFRSALRAASIATITVTYPPFDWEESHVDPLAQFADYWTFRPSSMSYTFEVDSSRWEGVNAGPPADPSDHWSRVTFGSFASADGSVAFRAAVGDELLRVEVRAEELPGSLPIFNLPFLEGQEFPAFTEDLTDAYARRLVVEIQGLGAVDVVFTGYDFSHGAPVRGVVVEPSRGVSTESSSWGAIKSLYH